MPPGPPKQFDREVALDRALGAFWRKGYEATGMSELLSEMQIGRQSLYDTYGGKKALYLEALEHYFERTLRTNNALLEAPGSPLGNLFGLFETMRAGAEESGYCGCFMGNTTAEFGGKDPEVEALIERFFARIEAAFAKVLRAARDAGEVDPDLPIEDTARLLIAVTQGAALMTKLEAGRPMASGVLRAAAALVGRR